MDYSDAPHHKSDQRKIKRENASAPYSSKPRQGKKKPKKITPTYLHNSGLYYLERFAASKKHFKTVMARKVKRSCMEHTDQNYDDCLKMVDEVADKFENLGLLNDDLYTNGVVTSLRRKGLSRKAILQKMQIKGIARDKAEDALNTIDAHNNHHGDENPELLAALKLARKKRLGPYMREDAEENIQKALGTFARAGFSYDISKTVLDMSTEDLEELGIYDFIRL